MDDRLLSIPCGGERDEAEGLSVVEELSSNANKGMTTLADSAFVAAAVAGAFVVVVVVVVVVVAAAGTCKGNADNDDDSNWSPFFLDDWRLSDFCFLCNTSAMLDENIKVGDRTSSISQFGIVAVAAVAAVVAAAVAAVLQ